VFDQPRQFESLAALSLWAETTTDGSLSDVPSVPDPGVWGPRLCRAWELPQQEMRVLRQLRLAGGQAADAFGNLLIVNHALFFSDLALRMRVCNICRSTTWDSG